MARVDALAGMFERLATRTAVPQATLVDTLTSLALFAPADEATAALAASLIDGLPESRLSPDLSGRLSRQIREAMNGGYLDRGQLDRLVADVGGVLDAASVAPPARHSIEVACRRVAREERNPRKDWW